jgi:hypothetical protein
MSQAEEAASIVSSLPPDKASMLLAFAHFLAEQADEQEWDERFAAASKSPRFQKRLAEVDHEIAQGKSLPLDLSQL